MAKQKKLKNNTVKDTQITLCKTMVRPLLSRGSKAWSIKENNKRIEAAGMCFLRS
jgi:hypothetical protein